MIRKRVALIAHDRMKAAMVAWVGRHRRALSGHDLIATGTTGRMIAEAEAGLSVSLLRSGPLGGDQQVGAMIAEGELDILIFFTDPLSTQPHDVDVKALTRLSTLYNVPMACNPATADFVVSSRFFSSAYVPETPIADLYNRERFDDGKERP
jgi:methylglyoxal synthase